MKKAEEYRDYASELESEREELLQELTNIAVGFTISDQPIAWSQATKLQDRAGRKLKKFAAKTETKKPKGYLYI